MNRTQSFLPVENHSAHRDASFLSTNQEQPVVLAPVKSKLEITALSRDAQTSSMNWLILGFMLLFHLGAIAALSSLPGPRWLSLSFSM